MEITRILRVLATILLVLTFILVTVSAYARSLEIGAMVRLSDATSSIITRLATNDLAWVDEEGARHCYVLDTNLLESLQFERSIGGDNFMLQVTISYCAGGSEVTFGPVGSEPPEDRMTCSLVVPVALWHSGRSIPAQLGVVVWYA